MIFKSLFSSARQGRSDDVELGKGVWRRSHDRFRRGLDRFHQMLEGVETDMSKPGANAVLSNAYAELVPIADVLAELLPKVRTIAQQAHAIAPSEGTEIPTGTGGYLNDVHRELSRAGNALAAAAEAVALVRLGVGEVRGVERKAGIVAGHVDRARELLKKR